jgi:hypothetical protein
MTKHYIREIRVSARTLGGIYATLKGLPKLRIVEWRGEFDERTDASTITHLSSPSLT